MSATFIHLVQDLAFPFVNHYNFKKNMPKKDNFFLRPMFAPNHIPTGFNHAWRRMLPLLDNIFNP